MPLPGLSEAIIRQHASDDSFGRGQAYLSDGAVVSLRQRGATLEAQVEGREPESYRVRCTFDDAGITAATCTCPYTYSGWCAHIVAALLAAARGQGIEERPSLDILLADLDRGQLQHLLLRLAEDDPALAEWVESETNLARGVRAASRSPRTRPPDLHAVRRQMIASLLHPPDRTDRGWYIFRLGPEASQLLEQVWALIRAGDGRTALDMLSAMTDECIDNWESVMEDDEGVTLDFVEERLGPAWREAILSVDLTASEREGWKAKLEAWGSALADYADSDSFEVALRALEEGWDDPALQRALRGEITHPELMEGEPTINGDDQNRLTAARLNILERQGRYDEYLNLARAVGQVARYTVMMVRQGHAVAAADYGLQHLARVDDALTLAQALREVGHMEEAMRIAEHGIQLEGKRAVLGTWLAELASGLGNAALASRAAIIAFQEEKNIASYLRVQELAGEDWLARREDLLGRLRETRDWNLQGPVDIFLHEGLIDDAIALLDRSSYPSPNLISQVAGAAIETNPAWVIQASRKQAEAIMDAAKSGAYGTAAEWLSKAKRAYLAAGREQEWRDYLASLLEKHRRKSRLMPLLRALR